MLRFYKLFLLYFLSCYLSSNAQQVESIQVLQYEEDMLNNGKTPLVPIQEYEIVNPIIYSLLDTAMFYTQNCIYYILNKPYYYQFYLKQQNDTVLITVRSKQSYGEYDWLNNSFHYCTNYGFFYYENNLVVFTSEKVNLNLFFTPKNDSLYSIVMPNTKCIQPWYGKICEYYNAQYTYSENKINRVNITPCGTLNYIIRYAINEKDTYENLAEQCRCFVETLHYIDGNYYDLPLKVGDMFFVKYELVDSMIDISRISLNTLYKEQEQQAQKLGLIPIKKQKKHKKIK